MQPFSNYRELVQQGERVPDHFLCLVCRNIRPEFWQDRWPASIRCHCLQQSQLAEEHRYQVANIPNRPSKGPSTLEAYSMPGNDEALQATKDFALGKPPHILVLFGSYGSGKTYLLEAAARFILEAGGRVHYAMATDLLDAIKGSFSSAAETPGQKDTSELLEFYKATPVLFLDDLGAERPTAFANERLTSIVDDRYRNEKRLMVTTNHSFQGLYNTGYERIAERLFDDVTGAARQIQLSGNFRRKEA